MKTIVKRRNLMGSSYETVNREKGKVVIALISEADVAK